MDISGSRLTDLLRFLRPNRDCPLLLKENNKLLENFRDAHMFHRQQVFDHADGIPHAKATLGSKCNNGLPIRDPIGPWCPITG